VRRTLAGVISGTAALVLASLAFAEVENKFQVAAQGERSYPRSLAVVIKSPPDYILDYMGRGGNDAAWKGPRYQATGLASLGGNAGLGWSAGLYRKPSTRDTIIANLVHDWPSIQEGGEPIERRVAGRTVTAITGTWMLTKAPPMAGDARYEAGLVFPLCGVTAYLGISALTPSTDSAGGTMGFGEYRMANGSKPSDWNREQVLATIRGIRLEGSMPAARLAARAAGRRVTGSARDCTGAPSAGLAVTLERRVGRRWVRAGRGTTSPVGAFAVAARSAGTYRTVVGNRRSAAVRVR
jgi:hypothetical protein